MTKKDAADAAAHAATSGKTGPWAALATWKKMLVVFSVVLMAGGGVAWTYAAMTGGGQSESTPADADGTGGGSSSLVQGFAPGQSGGSDADGASSRDASAMGDWAPVVFKFGFSFFVGFCIAFALRTFFKISLIAIGAVLLVLFGLQYAGMIDVNWSMFEERYDDVLGWLKSQTGSFKDFITGHLPSAGMAAFGLVVGFKKG